MRSWPAPEVPDLPGIPPPLHLFDSASGSVRPVNTHHSPIRMYVCGITPYDATHLGHAATYLAFDVIVRTLHDAGHQVHYVQNVTDIDDPLFARATRDGLMWSVLAEREVKLFRDDMAALRVIPPTDYIATTEVIPELVDHVGQLLRSGKAYQLDGDVYFSVDNDPHFGYESKLSTKDMRQLFADNGGDPQRPGKRNPLDPLVWQRAAENEPSWPSELGEGRPGWHMECTTIALTHLCKTVEIQGGGRDLAFPHHEMSAAQAEALTNQWPFAGHYVHTGLMQWRGEKMSKSRGNLVLVSSLRNAHVTPEEIRLALLASHYRADREWTDESLIKARERLVLWRTSVGQSRGPDGARTVHAVRAALANDVDTPLVLSIVDDWARETTQGGGTDPEAPRLVRTMVDALLGILL